MPEHRKSFSGNFCNASDALQYQKDYHHLLWYRKTWCKEQAKKLREYPYLKIIIPRKSLHQFIHCAIPSGIILPSERSCKTAYKALEIAARKGKIDPKNDSPSRRLQFLINIWKDDPTAAATIEGIAYQQQIFNRYFACLSSTEVAEFCHFPSLATCTL